MSTILCSALLLSTLAGCGEKEAEVTVKETTKTEEKSIINPAGEYPITNEDITLSVFTHTRTTVDDFVNNDFTKWYEEKTGVKVDFQVTNEKDRKEKMNLLLASGDYPDIFLNPTFSNEQTGLYGRQGIFIPLNDYIDKYGVETKKVFERYPYIEDQIAHDGQIYSLPNINQCYHCSMAQKMWIYKPWLDKLNLEVPTTTEELRTVLKAFKEQDPNGNNKADEIPLAGARTNTGWFVSIDAFLMNSFTFNDTSGQKRLYVNNDKVTASYTSDEWKEGLRYLNSLYNDGLLVAESFTQDRNQLKQMGENPDPILGVTLGGYQGQFAQTNSGSDRWKDYITVPPLEGPTGIRQTVEFPVKPEAGFVITDKCEYPEIAFRWADGMYEEEAMLRALFGRKDVDWKYAEEGEIGINGEPAIYTVLNDLGSEETKNRTWGQNSLNMRTPEFRLGRTQDADNPMEIILYNETKTKYEPYAADINLVLPNLTLTEEQASEVLDIETTIIEYIEESIAKFTVGTWNFDSDWDKYIKTLESMNIKRYLEIYQEAYDAR